MVQKLNNTFDQQIASKEQAHAAAIQKLAAAHDQEIQAHLQKE